MANAGNETHLLNGIFVSRKTEFFLALLRAAKETGEKTRKRVFSGRCQFGWRLALLCDVRGVQSIHSTGASFAHICSCLAAASPRRRKSRLCPCARLVLVVVVVDVLHQRHRVTEDDEPRLRWETAQFWPCAPLRSAFFLLHGNRNQQPSCVVSANKFRLLLRLSTSTTIIHFVPCFLCEGKSPLVIFYSATLVSESYCAKREAEKK